MWALAALKVRSTSLKSTSRTSLKAAFGCSVAQM